MSANLQAEWKSKTLPSSQISKEDLEQRHWQLGQLKHSNGIPSNKLERFITMKNYHFLKYSSFLEKSS